MNAREWRAWLVRLRNVVRRDRDDRDLADELMAHAALAAPHGGISDREMVRAMDALRDQRSLPSLEHLITDARHAARGLRRYPLFAAVAIATLTLGIGANAAIFAVINSVVLKPLGYPQSEQLMFLTTRVPALGLDEFWVSPPEYLEFRELNRSMASVGAFRRIDANVTAGDGPRRVSAALADHHLFHTLAVRAAHGRWFDQHEAEIKGPPVAVLSHELWQSAFGGRSMVGESIDVDGIRRTVVGVMPAGFDVMDQRVEIWLPLGLNPADRQNRATHYLHLIGRLKPGMTETAARTELDSLIANWGALTGVKGAGVAGHIFSPTGSPLPSSLSTPGHLLQMAPIKERIIGTARRSVWVVQAAAGLILLIACANLSSLLLARAESRRHEMAIRVAVGGSRTRLTQLFIVEGLLLSIPAALLGALIAYAGVPVLARAYLSSLPRVAEVSVDPAVIALTFAVAALAGVTFGLAPIAHLNVTQLASTMRSTDVRVSGSQRRYTTAALVVSQVAMAVAVSVSALLLVRTVWNLAAADGGFERSRLMTFSLSLPQTAFAQPAAPMQFYSRAVESVRELPGVESSAAMSALPLDRILDARAVDMEGYQATPDTTPEIIDFSQSVISNYFETMGIPIVRGRAFTAADAGSSGLVTIVNETLARTFWKDQDPIGRRLRMCCADNAPWYTVVGVARDVAQQAVDRKPGTEFYRLLDQTSRLGAPPATMHVVVRSTLPPAELRQSIERAIADIDPAIPVVKFRTLDAVFDDSIQRPQLLAKLLALFAALALLLAAIGIYGLLSHLVAGSRREIGIRMVMGASRLLVVTSVVRRGLLLTAIGGATGIAIAAVLARSLGTLLFGISPLDVATFTVALITVACIGTIACLLPALKAARVAPATVLREG
jgi:predicted permease